MFRREGDGAYLDVFERTLYNGYLSGVSLAGDTFFYQNPLESDGKAERSSYFDVACCPANLARLMAQLPGFIYAQGGPSTLRQAQGRPEPGRGATGLMGSRQADSRQSDVYVNLFIGSETTLRVGAVSVRLAQTTEYPWDGKVAIRVDPEKPIDMTLRVRVPGWARGEAVPSDLYRFLDEDAGRLKAVPPCASPT